MSGSKSRSPKWEGAPREAVPQPLLTEPPLRLTPFEPEDVPLLVQLAGDRAIADTTLLVPHPYTEHDAIRWIAAHAKKWEAGQGVVFAIRMTSSPDVIGAIGLEIESTHERGELGYWIGKPHWNRGYATSAVRMVTAFGFEFFGLNRLYAMHMTRNSASGRVLEKGGWTWEGRLREHVKKWGVFEDVELYGITRGAWRQATGRR
jgi:RimJ/RimL family protein N-acetyltransferase